MIMIILMVYWPSQQTLTFSTKFWWCIATLGIETTSINDTDTSQLLWEIHVKAFQIEASLFVILLLSLLLLEETCTCWSQTWPTDPSTTVVLWWQGHALVVLFLRKSEAFDAEFVLGVGKCAMSSSGWGCFQKMMLRWFCWNQLSLIGNTNWNDMLYCGCVSNMVGPYNSISEITVRLLWILRDPHGPSICAYTISNWTCNHELYQSFLFDLVVEQILGN